MTEASGVGLAVGVGEGGTAGVDEAVVAEGPDLAPPPEQPATKPTTSASAAAPTQARPDIGHVLMRRAETSREEAISVSPTTHLVDSSRLGVLR